MGRPKKQKKVLDPVEDFDKPVKQERLAGMENAAVEEIEQAAATCKDYEQRRMSLLRREMDARALLLAIMKKHGRLKYRYNGWEVTTTETKEKVKVKQYDEEADSAFPDNANPGGEDQPGSSPAPKGDQEQSEVADPSTEASEEGDEAGGEAPPF